MTRPPQWEELLGRVKGEFLEMPGLRLTSAQARRLWGLDQETCDRILSTLVERSFLTCTRDGAFVMHDGVLLGGAA